jgi:GWxTD domain-containing protein
MNRLIVIFIFLLLCLNYSCKTSQQIVRTKVNLADVYNPGKSTLHPDYSVYHLNDSLSVLYIRIYPAELLFNQANEDGEFQAKLKISYILSSISDQTRESQISDTSSVIKVLKRSSMRNSYFTAIPLSVTYGNRYMLQLDFSDELRNTGSKHFVSIDKTSKFNSQNFNVFLASSDILSFSKTFTSENSFRIRFNQVGYDSLFVNYFTLDRTLPRPVFSSAPDIPLKTYPDSSWVLPYADTILYSMQMPGIYQFRVDPKSDQALSLFNFNESFPGIKNPDDLLGPLVYLTSSAEFRDLRMQANRKLAIDNFWLKLTEDMDAARELIRVYYNRTFYANIYFTSFKEGWKTDRGMIFIIFGPPNLLEKTVNEEKWTYFTRKNSSSIEFVFERKENPFTGQDYELNRNVNSSNIWSEAIRTWRRGKIYSPEY